MRAARCDASRAARPHSLGVVEIVFAVRGRVARHAHAEALAGRGERELLLPAFAPQATPGVRGVLLAEPSREMAAAKRDANALAGRRADEAADSVGDAPGVFSFCLPTASPLSFLSTRSGGLYSCFLLPSLILG